MAPTATPTPVTTVTPEEPEKDSVKVKWMTETYARWQGKKFVVTWSKVEGAEGYDILATKCGKTLNEKSIVKTVGGDKTSFTLAKIAGKKLSGKQQYKVRIKAFKKVDGKKVCIGKSQTCHVAGRTNKIFTNAKKVKVSSGMVVLQPGKTIQIKAKIVKQAKKKKLLPDWHGAALKYYSTDDSTVSVTANGKLKAKKSGKCSIYVTAINGIGVKVNVTVESGK